MGMAWGKSVVQVLEAMRKREEQQGPTEFCQRQVVDYDLVMILRDDVVLQCTHNAAWYQEQIPLCQGWKVRCSDQEPVVGIGFGGAEDVDFPAVPTVMVVNSFGARLISTKLAAFIWSNAPWPPSDASESEILTWLR